MAGFTLYRAIPLQRATISYAIFQRVKSEGPVTPTSAECFMSTRPGPYGPLKAAAKPTGSCNVTFFTDALHQMHLLTRMRTMARPGQLSSAQRSAALHGTAQHCPAQPSTVHTNPAQHVAAACLIGYEITPAQTQCRLSQCITAQDSNSAALQHTAPSHMPVHTSLHKPGCITGHALEQTAASSIR